MIECHIDLEKNTVANYLNDPSSVDKVFKDVIEGGMTNRLRVTRNGLLAECDWTVLPDSALTDSKKTEWETYRQELRDLPSTASPSINESGNLINVTWPTKPE